MRECEQRFGKTLDEDVKMGVILALAPSQVQLPLELTHCSQVRTMLFDYCRAQEVMAAVDAVPMDLLMLGKGNGKKGKGDKKGKDDKKGKAKGKGKNSENSKDEKDKDEDKKGQGLC